MDVITEHLCRVVQVLLTVDYMRKLFVVSGVNISTYKKVYTNSNLAIILLAPVLVHHSNIFIIFIESYEIPKFSLIIYSIMTLT